MFGAQVGQARRGCGDEVGVFRLPEPRVAQPPSIPPLKGEGDTYYSAGAG